MVQLSEAGLRVASLRDTTIPIKTTEIIFILTANHYLLTLLILNSLIYYAVLRDLDFTPYSKIPRVRNLRALKLVTWLCPIHPCNKIQEIL